MMLRKSLAILALGWLYGLSTACSDGSAGFGGIGGGSSKKSEDSGESDDAGDESPSEPVRIAGSYLTCNELNYNREGDLEDLRDSATSPLKLTATEGEAFIACGIYSETTDEKVQIDSKIYPRAINDDGDRVTLDSKATAEESYYHFAAFLPPELRSGAKIEARIVGSDVNATKETETEKILPLYRPTSTRDLPPTTTGTPDDLTIEFEAYWLPSSIFTVNAIDPRDFCDDGDVRDEMRANNRYLAGLGGISGNIIKAEDDNDELDLRAKAATCIEPITTFNSYVPGSSSKSYLAEAEGCMFFQTNEPRLYIIEADDSDYDEQSEIDELNDIISQSLCK